MLVYYYKLFKTLLLIYLSVLVTYDNIDFVYFIDDLHLLYNLINSSLLFLNLVLIIIIQIVVIYMNHWFLKVLY